MSARASKRAQNALYGRASIGGKGQTTIVAADGRRTTTTDGSVINWGGNDKSGLYPTVGVSVGFLNQLSSCCRTPFPRGGVNTSPYTSFMNF
jgi:hypothetical protein